MDLYQALGAHIRHHRRLLDMSQEALAERVKLPVEIVGKIERGTTSSSFETVQKIAAALVLPPLALFGVSDADAPAGERGKLLGRITKVLSNLNDEQLERFAKMVEAFAGAG